MRTLFAIAPVLAALTISTTASLTPLDLQCDGRTDPIAAPTTPRLSWRVESGERGQTQAAWQLLVASSAELLKKDQGDLWDSGKQSAKRAPFVAYGGKVTTPGQRYHWKVRSWDADGKESVWSAPSTWETAPMNPADWSGARWIDDGKELPTEDADFYKPDPAPLMRREFQIAKPVVRARLHVAGLGLCMPSLNGERLADHVFDPPWTNFDKRILFRTHDVTEQIKDGDNCLGITLGNGWYNPLPLRMWGHRNIRGSLPVGRPRAIAFLIAEHPDGTQTKITTGPEWTTTEGPTTRNSIYLGEERDARLALPGWDTVSSEPCNWREVRVTDHPLEPLQPLSMPPVRLKEKLTATKVTTPQQGVHIVDFGRNFTGIPEVDLRVPAGTKVTFRFGELLHEDGNLNPMTSVCGQIKGTRKQKDGTMRPVGGPGAPGIAWQQNVYIARGGGLETYRPDFTFHGFRYMEITGLPEAPAPATCRAFPIRTDLADAGSFSCSNERLNQIQKISRNTFLAGVMTVQSDCPHRERFAYGGDIVATSEAFLMNFDMSGFYTKTVRDWTDAARPDGRFTDTAPFVGIDYCGVGWAMAHPLLLEQLYNHYGDISLLQEQVPAAIKWLDGEADRRQDGLVTKGLGDHEALVKARGPILTTAMFVDTALRVARLARVIGLDADAKRFEDMANQSAAAWRVAFLDAATGKVGEGSQSAQTFALGFGATPPAVRPAVFKHLVADLTAPDDGPRLTTGIFGTHILLEELSKNGRSDLAYALADRNTFPSWGWMLENDATTLWEHWAFSDNTFSHSHPMFGSISAWFFRWLGGIQPADDAVGFDRIVIRPQTVSGLEWVKCSHQSVRGPIESNWSVTDGKRRFEIAIPPNTTAVVDLPSRPGDVLTEGDQPIAKSKDVEILDSKPGNHRLRIGSGRYQFTLAPRP